MMDWESHTNDENHPKTDYVTPEASREMYIVGTQRERLSESPRYDEYGFALDETEISGTDLSEEEARLSMWEPILLEWDQWQDERLSYIIICEGLPRTLRSTVWKKLLNLENFKQPSSDYYRSLVSQSDTLISSHIKRDLKRTYVNHVLFRSEEGCKSMFNILRAYSSYNKIVGYCQGMNFVVGNLLMHMCEQEAFWAFVALLDKVDSTNYDQDMKGVLEADTTFGRLLRLHNPELKKHFDENEVSTLFCTSRWFVMLFTNLQNWNTVLRLWDVIMYEGRKALFRIALALMTICKEDLLLLRSEMDVIPYLLSIPKRHLKTSVVLSQVYRVKIHQLLLYLENEDKAKVPAVLQPKQNNTKVFDTLSQLFSKREERRRSLLFPNTLSRYNLKLFLQVLMPDRPSSDHKIYRILFPENNNHHLNMEDVLQYEVTVLTSIKRWKDGEPIECLILLFNEAMWVLRATLSITGSNTNTYAFLFSWNMQDIKIALGDAKRQRVDIPSIRILHAKMGLMELVFPDEKNRAACYEVFQEVAEEVGTLPGCCKPIGKTVLAPANLPLTPITPSKLIPRIVQKRSNSVTPQQRRSAQVVFPETPSVFTRSERSETVPRLRPLKALSSNVKEDGNEQPEEIIKVLFLETPKS